MFFLFLHENICCGYSLEAPDGTHKIRFRGEIRQNIYLIPTLIQTYVFDIVYTSDVDS